MERPMYGTLEVTRPEMDLDSFARQRARERGLRADPNLLVYRPHNRRIIDVGYVELGFGAVKIEGLEQRS